MLSCSFSSSRCNSAAVSGLGCRIGPCEVAGKSAMTALGGRGELGRLLLVGTGGGPITDDVLLDRPVLVWSASALFEADAVCEVPRRGCELRSGGAIVTWVFQNSSTKDCSAVVGSGRIEIAPVDNVKHQFTGRNYKIEISSLPISRILDQSTAGLC